MRRSPEAEARHIQKCMSAPTLTSAFTEPYVVKRPPLIWPKPVKYLSPREKQLAIEDAELDRIGQ